MSRLYLLRKLVHIFFVVLLRWQQYCSKTNIQFLFILSYRYISTISEVVSKHSTSRIITIPINTSVILFTSSLVTKNWKNVILFISEFVKILFLFWKTEGSILQNVSPLLFLPCSSSNRSKCLPAYKTSDKRRKYFQRYIAFFLFYIPFYDIFLFSSDFLVWND